MSTINQRMKMVRKSVGLTINEFGARLGVSGASVSMTENGKNGVSEQNVRAIVREFNVNETWFRTGEGEMFNELSSPEQISIFLGDILKDDNTFRLRLISVLARMEPDEWAMLEKRLTEITEELKKPPQE